MGLLNLVVNVALGVTEVVSDGDLNKAISFVHLIYSTASASY
ncbi:hypothetical protein [Saccharolobus solfataricus]|uniref:Uncharacterized protein n=1 Tax=Saccharolobus solfataricus (strain 98/2) TaxID=555311 RepID=D0KQB5_SACS9|nr:hypothetical protein [Saccharolobus solfataricus]